MSLSGSGHVASATQALQREDKTVPTKYLHFAFNNAIASCTKVPNASALVCHEEEKRDSVAHVLTLQLQQFTQFNASMAVCLGHPGGKAARHKRLALIKLKTTRQKERNLHGWSTPIPAQNFPCSCPWRMYISPKITARSRRSSVSSR